MKQKLLFLIPIILLFASCGSFKEKPTAEEGVIDISSWNFEKDGILKLDGQWEFYYEQLLTPQNIDNNNNFSYQPVPSDWNKYIIDGKKITGRTYGTYRLKILPNPNDTIYVFRIGRIDVSYNLYANNKLIASAGTVADNKKDNKAEWVIKTAEIDVTDTIELVLQIANFKHKKGGVKASIGISPVKQMVAFQEKTFALDFFLIGLLLITSLYHFVLFYLRPKDKVTLYFALLSLWVILHLIVEQNIVLKFLFPEFNWEILMKINFLANFARIFFISIFFYYSFKQEFSKIFIQILTVIVISMSVLILVTPASVYTHVLPVFLITVIITLPYLIFVIIKASIRKKEGALLALSGMIILLGTAINDLLYNELIINTGYLVPYGLASFILFHSVMISVRFTKALNTVEKLSDDLTNLNKNLENKVKERTQEIEQQKEELKSQTDSLYKINIAVNQKNELLELKNKQITDSINYASRIQQALLPTQNLFEQNFSEHFILYKPKSVVSGDFYYLKKVNNQIIIAVADCTGHGVPGAFVSMLGISSLNEIINKKHIKTASNVLEELRKNVIAALQHNEQSVVSDGMDIALVSIDTNTNTLQYAGAYSPIYVVQNNNLKKLKPTLNPIGTYVKTLPFENTEIKLQKGDVLYLFTDGYHDQYGGKNIEKFSTTRFDNLIQKNYQKPLDEQKEIFDINLKEWQGNNRQIDDILIVGIKI